nr:class I SAM-dependent methyltransferase [Labilithrix luteola]
MIATLHSPKVAGVLEHLFADAAKVDHEELAPFQAMSRADRDAVFASMKDDYRTFYRKMNRAYLPVSAEFGRFLYVLARTRDAKTIVEFGTSFGISTIHLAAALRDNGGGRLVTTEFEPTKTERARKNLTDAGLVDLVEFRDGDALETLRDGVGAPIDLLLLDGAKPLYMPLLERLVSHLAPGAVVAADNAKDSPELVAHLRNPANGYVSLSIPWDGDDNEVAVRA